MVETVTYHDDPEGMRPYIDAAIGRPVLVNGEVIVIGKREWQFSAKRFQVWFIRPTAETWPG